MSNKPRVKWKHVEKYCKAHGYQIYSQGGDKIIKAPPGKSISGNFPTVLIGHKCCGHKNDEVFEVYVKKLEHRFGITRKDLLQS